MRYTLCCDVCPGHTWGMAGAVSRISISHERALGHIKAWGGAIPVPAPSSRPRLAHSRLPPHHTPPGQALSWVSGRRAPLPLVLGARPGQDSGRRALPDRAGERGGHFEPFSDSKSPRRSQVPQQQNFKVAAHYGPCHPGPWSLSSWLHLNPLPPAPGGGLAAGGGGRVKEPRPPGTPLSGGYSDTAAARQPLSRRSVNGSAQVRGWTAAARRRPRVATARTTGLANSRTLAGMRVMGRIDRGRLRPGTLCGPSPVPCTEQSKAPCIPLPEPGSSWSGRPLHITSSLSLILPGEGGT